MKKYLEENNRILIINVILLILGSLIFVFATISFKKQENYQTKYSVRDNVTRVEMLSDYSPYLKGTKADTEIYVIEGEEKGPSILILGGTHGNEPSGNVAAALILENAIAKKGTIYVIPETNKSGLNNTLPQEGSTQFYQIETPFGKRTFKFGNRMTNFTDQWPNPEIYVHPQSGQKLSSNDAGNLNRAYPGKLKGTLTERIAYGVIALINENEITMTLDLHEASPEYLTNNAIVAHTRKETQTISGTVWYLLEMEGIRVKREDSPANLRGLSHREIGDYTDTLVFLSETSNAAQGRLRGAFTEDLILTGEDKFYQHAKKIGVEIFGEPTTITERVARHVATALALMEGYNLEFGSSDDMFEIGNIPTYYEIINAEFGVGSYLLEIKE